MGQSSESPACACVCIQSVKEGEDPLFDSAGTHDDESTGFRANSQVQGGQVALKARMPGQPRRKSAPKKKAGGGDSADNEQQRPSQSAASSSSYPSASAAAPSVEPYPFRHLHSAPVPTAAQSLSATPATTLPPTPTSRSHHQSGSTPMSDIFKRSPEIQQGASSLISLTPPTVHQNFFDSDGGTGAHTSGW
jgi:hypothetical protein